MAIALLSFNVSLTQYDLQTFARLMRNVPPLSALSTAAVSFHINTLFFHCQLFFFGARTPSGPRARLCVNKLRKCHDRKPSKFLPILALLPKGKAFLAVEKRNSPMASHWVSRCLSHQYAVTGIALIIAAEVALWMQADINNTNKGVRASSEGKARDGYPYVECNVTMDWELFKGHWQRTTDCESMRF